jgi:hypothetical protein
MTYPSDVKVIVHVELVNGETRDYGISADSPSILGWLGKQGKENGFVSLWNKQESHMVNYESIRTMRATRYERPEDAGEPKEKRTTKRTKDKRQEEISF